MGMILSSCGDTPVTHNYSEEWTSAGEEGHYHLCVDEGYEDLHTKVEPHTYGDPVVIEPTYEAGGYTTHTCTACGYSYRDNETHRLEHHYAEEWTSGGEAGHYHMCIDEGYESEHSPIEDHEYGDPVTTAPTYEAGGYDTYTCTKCGYSYTDNETAKLEHKYSDEWSSDSTKHWRRCIDSGYTNLRTDEGPHEYNIYKYTVDPTYTAIGYDVYGCICGRTEITNRVPKLEHKYSEAWTTSPTQHWHVCIDPGYSHLTTTKEDHYSDTWIVDTPATETTAGARHKECDACGYNFIQEVIPSGQERSSTRILSFSGSTDFYVSGCLNPQVKKVQIPSQKINSKGVLCDVYAIIGAFKECWALEEVIIPEGITRIGANSFVNCYNLKSLTLPSTLTTINDDAFKGCYSLAEIVNKSSLNIVAGSSTLGGVARYASSVVTDESLSRLHETEDGIVYIQKDNGDKYFRGVDYEATDVVIDDTYANFNKFAFVGHRNLKSVDISNNSYFKNTLHVVQDEMFKNCVSLETVKLPNEVTKIGVDAFNSCYNLKSINIPTSLTEIGEKAFASCFSITELTIPNGVNIGPRAFGSMKNLRKLTLPSTLTSIPEGLCFGCESLDEITIPEGVVTIETSAFSSCYALKCIELPSTFTTANNYAFNECYRLYEVVNHSSVDINYSHTYISDNWMGGLGYNLHSIITDKSQTKITYHEDGFVTFNDNYDGVTLLDYVGSEHVITIPSYIAKLNEYSLAYREIYSLNTAHISYIPQRLTYENNRLVQLIFGTGLTYCDYNCVDNSSLLEVVNLSSTELSSSLPVLDNAKNYVRSLDDATATFDTYITVTTSEHKYFFGTMEDIEKVNVPEGVTYIWDYSFANRYKLKEVHYSSTVTTIGQNVFYYCNTVNKVYFPASLTTLYSYAYNGGASDLLYFYQGTSEDYAKISVGYQGSASPKIAYYSEVEPESSGRRWHYVNNEMVMW